MRRTCALLSVARSGLHYESQMVSKDSPVLSAMALLSAQYPRYGYCRIQVFLERQGPRMSANRAWRLWRKAGLQVPRKCPRKRSATMRPRPCPPTGAGQVWAYDFVFDASANGQQLKCLTVIDEYPRESLAIDVAGSIRGSVAADQRAWHAEGAALRQRSRVRFLRAAQVGEQPESRYGAHRSLQAVAERHDGEFQRKFRDECLSMEWFRNRIEAKAVIEQWCQHYNHVRSHSSLGNQTPAAFKKHCVSSTYPEAVLQD